MSYFSVFVAFVVIPTLDLLLDNKSSSYIESNKWYYSALLYIQIPIHFGLFFLFFERISISSNTFIELVGLTFAMGINCGVIAINIAHELGHRSNKTEQLMAKCLLISTMYYQFFIDHNKGHHKHVSTPNDPSSAKKNQSVYSFIISSLIGTFKSAYKLDSNQMSKGLIAELILVILVLIIYGVKVTFFFMLAALLGCVLLECVNYIEHYGLKRKLNSSGRYEKVQVHHSWNSNHLIGRGVLFNLSRHSDHHYMVSKKYQQLQNHTDAPQMPTGYPGMILLSLIPKVWFKIMNKRIPRT